MLVELIIGGGLLAAGGLGGYLYYEQGRSRAAQAENDRVRLAAFREELVQELRLARGDRFRWSDFVEARDVTPEEATSVAENLFAGFAGKVVADGVITPEERSKLDGLARTLQIDSQRARVIEKDAKGRVYREAVSGVLADGIVSPQEASQLDALRRSLGIASTDSVGMAGEITRDAYVAMLRRIVDEGILSPKAEVDLARFKQALHLSDADATNYVREWAVDLYRQAFSSVVQDGVVTPQEESFLGWIQREAGLSDRAVGEFRDRLEEVKRLAEYRSGNLPSIRTKKLLEGGEICHWDGPCSHVYETATKTLVVAGELVVTSKRVLLNSPNKNFSFAPWKVIDIDLISDGITIKVDARQGTGKYFVSDPVELEAILVGVARRTKFTATQGYSSTASRHIPGEVKREVWARDGGRCVNCGTGGRGVDLEFDHIIPHSLGGANTVKNIQLLCRKCNNLKSDRI